MEIVARDLRTRLGMLAVTVGWHRFGYPDGAFGAEEKRHGIHGGDIETSLMLAAQPGTVRMDKAANATPATIAMAREFKWLGAYRPAGFAWMTQDLHPTGALGDATLATAEKGEAALAHGARGVRGTAPRDRPLRSFAAARRAAGGAEGILSPSFRGARSASPESITTAARQTRGASSACSVIMDSGFRPSAGPGMTITPRSSRIRNRRACCRCRRAAARSSWRIGRARPRAASGWR